jgi:hypothetical protein
LKNKGKKMNKKINTVDDRSGDAGNHLGQTDPATPSQLPPIVDLANRSSRSTIAVIDTVVQRGGFRGEELSTIGQLRDQCVQIVALAETEMQNLAQE